jgi:hypothetical protein
MGWELEEPKGPTGPPKGTWLKRPTQLSTPLGSGRVPFPSDIRGKCGWNPIQMDKILVQIVYMDCIREALGGC